MNSLEQKKNEENNPLVSILCLTFNHEKFLRQALDSFLMQKTSFPFEIVVAEDASSDGTAGILAEYSASFPHKIRAIFNGSNLGMIENAVQAQALCRGKYIAACEGDDYWTDPEKLQKQVDFLEASPDYVLSFHDALVMNNEIIESRPRHFGYMRRDLRKEELLRAAQLPTLTVCYRNILKEIPEDFHCSPILDLCIWSLLGAHGKGKFMPNIRPAIYRVHSHGAISMKAQEVKYRMTMRTMSLLSGYWEKQGDVDLARFLTRKSVFMGIMGFSFSQIWSLFFKIPIYSFLRIAQIFKQKIGNKC